MNYLDFGQLRHHANVERQHYFPTVCKDWRLGQWSNATLGELGEAANLIKKIERGDTSLFMQREALAKELADAALYLDLLAWKAGINLGEAIRSKFNQTSTKMNIPILL